MGNNSSEGGGLKLVKNKDENGHMGMYETKNI